MTANERPVVDTALAYYRAWTSGDLDGALALVADDVVLHTPSGTMAGASALRAFMGPFAGSITGSTLLAASGDGAEALIMYDTATPSVVSAPGAELHRIVGGRIVELRIVFDRSPFALARGDVFPA